MISFADGHGASNYSSGPPKEIKKLVEAILSEDPYAEGSCHGGLHPDYIKEIVNHLMFVEGNEAIYIIIDKEPDGFHLSLTVDRKEK